MKKFKFRMDKIRKLREDSKKRAQRLFAKAKLEEESERRMLGTLENEAELRREIELKARLNKVNPERLRRSSDYIGQLDFLISHQTTKVHEAAAVSDEKRKLLLEASREEKKYERLEDLQREQYNKQMELLLQKETDEIALQSLKKR